MLKPNEALVDTPCRIPASNPTEELILTLYIQYFTLKDITHTRRSLQTPLRAIQPGKAPHYNRKQTLTTNTQPLLTKPLQRPNKKQHKPWESSILQTRVGAEYTENHVRAFGSIHDLGALAKGPCAHTVLM